MNGTDCGDGQGPTTDAFAEHWLAEQRRFWEGWARGAGHGSFAEAGEAWERACEEWWQHTAGALPPPLDGAVRNALQHTRVCLSLLRGAAEHGAGGPLTEPALLYAAALDAMRPAAGEGPEGAEAAYLRAWQAWVEALGEIATGALDAIRTRIRDERPRDPAALYAVYAEEVERRYREQAGSPRFARLMGDLVNARVDVLAAGRRP